MIKRHKKGGFILVEGIEHSGKTTIVNFVLDYFQEKGLRIFDVKQFWLREGRYPRMEEIQHFDLFYTLEPTKVGVGNVIRSEILSSSGVRDYTPLEVSSVFAVDRLILYRKLVIPLMRAGKIVVQERGVCTGFATQYVQAQVSSETFSLSDFLRLPGNTLTLRHPPNIIFVTDCDLNAIVRNQTEEMGVCSLYDYPFQKKVFSVLKSRLMLRMMRRMKVSYLFIPTIGKATVQEMKSNVFGHLSQPSV